MRQPRSAIWHDVECGGLRRRPATCGASSAARRGGPVLELGCGTGRVALELAAVAASTWSALDRSRELLATLRASARGGRAGGRRRCARDARELALGRELRRSCSRRCSSCSCSTAASERGRLLAAIAERPAPRRHLRGGAARRGRARGRTTAGRRRCSPTCARSTAGSTRACRSRSPPGGWARAPSPAPDRLAGGGADARRTDAIRLAELSPGRLEAGGAPAGLRPRRADRDRADGRPRRLASSASLEATG